MSLSDQLWSPTSAQVTVLQARGLRIKGKNGTNDAYAVMQVGKEKYQTSVAEKSVAPIWKEEASFDMPSAHQGGTERGTLHVHVLHRALVGPDKLLGLAVINLLQLSEDTSRDKTQWFKLLDKAGKPDKDRGEVLVDIQFMRNNMTASMFDISAAGKSRSRLSKLKDKVRGKKKDGLSETASNVVPSFSQVLTDSEDEGNSDGEGAAGKDEKKKKSKVKSLFSHKSNLQKNLSQSMSVLPGKNSSLSGSMSSGLNVEASEGKKKFKFLSHKRTGSSDKKDQKLGAEQSNLCINGSHIYCEEPAPRTSRTSSNFSLTSSGVGSMEDVPDSSPPSVGSTRSVRHNSPWTEEEEEETIEESTQEVDEEMFRRQELEKLAEEESRFEEEEEQRRAAEEKKLEEDRRQREEEERLRMEEEQRRREEEIKIERERLQKEDEEKRAAEMLRVEEERKQREEEERRLQEEEKERRRIEEEEQRRKEEEEKREKERIRKEELRMRLEEEKQRQEEEERRQEEERRAMEKRRQEEKEEEMRKMEEEKARKERLLEEERKQKEEQERIRKEEEEKFRMEKERAEEELRIEEERKLKEERKKLEEEEKIRKAQEEEEKRRIEREEKRQREEEERVRKAREEQKRLEEEERRQRELKEEQERIRKEEEKIRVEKERAEEELRRQREEEEYERLMEEKRKQEEEERRQQMEEEKKRRREEKEALEMERLVEEKRQDEEQKRRVEEEERVKMLDDRKASETQDMTANPFDESDEHNPSEDVPDSTARVTSARQRCKLPSERNTCSFGENDVNTTQQEKRHAPKPPRMASSERQQVAQHEVQVNKPSKDKEIKTASVVPQRAVQKISPVSAPSSHINNSKQPEHVASTARTASSGRWAAPQRPGSEDEEGLSSKGYTTHGPVPKSKQAPAVYGLNPFEDDEDADELTNQHTATTTPGSLMWPPPVQQSGAKDVASQMKIKSSKTAHAPAPPAKKAHTSSTDKNHDTDVTIFEINVDKSSAPVQQPLHKESQCVQEEAVKKDALPVPSRRLQPVRPLNPSDQQPVSAVQGERDNKSTGEIINGQGKTKVSDTGPYALLTQEELISLVLKQERQLSEKNNKISELEQYIDNLLVRVIEEAPSILMTMTLK